MKTVFFLTFCVLSGTALGKSVQKDPIRSPEIFRERKQFLSWLFGDNPNFRTDETANHTVENIPNSEVPQQKPNVTIFRIGPFVFTDNNNPNLGQSANSTIEDTKGNLTERAKDNQVRSRRALPATKPRRKARSGSHVISKRQTYLGGMTPQQQMLLLQQQALLQQQQQLYGTNNQLHQLQHFPRRRRRRPQYEDYDDDDDDSDEFDFDSDEFSSFPIV